MVATGREPVEPAAKPPPRVLGQEAFSCVGIVDIVANGRWSSTQIDATVHSWFVTDPSSEGWLEQQPVGITR